MQTPVPVLSRRPCRAIAALAFSLFAGCAWSGPPPWPEAPYSYYANNFKLEAVLADFASGFSLSLSMAPEVSGTVNGRFAAKNPTEHISRLGGIYGFVWYTHGGTLFVSRASDVTTRSIAAPGGGITNMRKALTDLGVLEPRFGWGELSEQGVALVSGPPSYVNLVDATVRSLPARAPKVGVFRLRHASADDRTVMYRDREFVTPGLSTILRGLVSERGRSGTAVSYVSPVTRVSASDGSGASAPAGPAAGMLASPAGGSGSIQSDPRLNAIIVQDTPERMPIYAQLIEQLDVPTSLIEIEAVIIDINTARAKELGVSWAGRSGNNSVTLGTFSASGNGTINLASGSGTSASSLVLPAGNALLAQLRLLESEGDAQIQGRPSVLTVENLGALLDLSETFYIKVEAERVASVTPVTTGTTLRVTPRVIVDGERRMVQMLIDIEDGQIQERMIGSLPTVRRSSVSTQAIVMNGEALLIAGYRSDHSMVSTDRVPVLGELPGIGLAFSQKTRNTQKRERMFLIRPKVIALQAPPEAVKVPLTEEKPQ